MEEKEAPSGKLSCNKVDSTMPESSSPHSPVGSSSGTSMVASPSAAAKRDVEPGKSIPEQVVGPTNDVSTISDASPSNEPAACGHESEMSSPQDTIQEETAEMYASVASAVASKVHQVEKRSRQIESGVPQNNATVKPKNESLSLIMSYNDASDGSSDETEKEEEPANNFSSLRYAPISSGCSSDDDQSSEEDENTDAGSSNDEHSDRDSDVEEVPLPVAVEEKPTAAAQVAPKDRKRNDLKDPLMLDLLPPIEKLSISVPEEDCVPVGKVYSIVDRLLVIESLPDTPPLMLDSVIFTREGSPLGQIFDIFGHVKRPFYSIRFNAPDDIKVLNVSIGRVVYCAPKTDHTKYVFTHDLLKEKGSDASWKHDEEPPPNCIDYSDDEAERTAKKGSKAKKEKEVDSPARRRHLSFEQLMNRNNTLRNRAFKRDSQGEARNWDGGWHNYKKASAQLQQITSEPPPPPPPRQLQPCVYSNPAGVVNPMNIVIRPPCFNPVIERPAVSFSPSPSGFTMTPPHWARFEPPPTPPPRGFQYPNSPPSTGAFHRFDPVAPPPNFGLFHRFQPSPPSSGPFQAYGSPSQYGPSGFGPSFSSPPPPPIPMQPPASSRYGPPPNCPPSIPIPPPPFSANYPSYHPPKPNNSNNPNPLPPHIPRLPYSSNNNHPPLYNHPPF